MNCTILQIAAVMGRNEILVGHKSNLASTVAHNSWIIAKLETYLRTLHTPQFTSMGDT